MRIDGEMITQALKIIHGGNNVSSMKLSLEEKKQVFKMQDDSVTEKTTTPDLSTAFPHDEAAEVYVAKSPCSLYLHSGQEKKCGHPL